MHLNMLSHSCCDVTGHSEVFAVMCGLATDFLAKPKRFVCFTPRNLQPFATRATRTMSTAARLKATSATMEMETLRITKEHAVQRVRS